jgi:hypothetical protein
VYILALFGRFVNTLAPSGRFLEARGHFLSV